MTALPWLQENVIIVLRGKKKTLLHLKAQHEPFSYIMHH